MQNPVSVNGVLVEGYHVASRPSKEYPEYGTIEKQKPVFKKLGFSEIDRVYNGTLNVLIFPRTFEVVKPEITFKDVEWTDLHPPETFSFSRCMITFRGVPHHGWVYYPHPETKKRHFQNPFLIELLAERIPGIGYGDRLKIQINGDEISIKSASPLLMLGHFPTLVKHLGYMFRY